MVSLERIIVVTILLVIVGFTSQAQEKSSRPAFLMSLQLTADDSFRNILYSNLTKQLRSFDDIKLVNQQSAEYELNLVVLEANSGIYVCSVLVNRFVRYEEIVKVAVVLELVGEGYTNFDSPLFERKEQKKIAKFDSSLIAKHIKRSLVGVAEQKYYGIFTDNSLSILTDRIIAEINVEVLENQRKVMDQVLMESQ